MALEVLKLSDVVARLKNQVAAFKSIEGAAEFENAVRGRVRATPAGFVIPLKEDAGSNTTGSLVVTQDITDHFAIAYAVKDVKGPVGEEGIDTELRNLRLATLAAIVGWVPGAGFDVCEFDGGQLIRIDGGVVFWRDRFKTTHINES